MTYTVWILVEDDDAPVGKGRTYWSVDHFDTKRDAVDHAKEMADAEYERTGNEPRIDKKD